MGVCATDRAGEPTPIGPRPAEAGDVRYPMGGDHRQATLALAGLSPAAETVLYESMLIAIRNQQRASRARAGSYRVIVVLTDGENGAGRVEFDEVLDDARRSGILTYPVVLPTNDAPQSGPSWRMTQLALDTGGKIASGTCRHRSCVTARGISCRCARADPHVMAR